MIGPRPERREFVDQLTEKVPYYNKRHFTKPGVTGWAQVRYPYGSSENDALEKLRYDLYYIKNYSITLDLTAGGAMYRWLERDLATNRLKWTIVFFHVPPYSKGSHDSDSEYATTMMRDLSSRVLSARPSLRLRSMMGRTVPRSEQTPTM